MSQTSDNSPANSYVDEFIAYLRTVRNLSDNTTRAYSVDLASYISWCKREELDPLQATHRSLRAYLSYLDQARYSARTLNRHLSALRGFYKWLNKEKYLEVDPLEKPP